jgi:hypothetical protein
MTDYAELIERLKRFAEQYPGAGMGHFAGLAVDAAEAIAKLSAENAELRKDAQRYRWLRGDVQGHSERWPRWELRRWDGKTWHSLERSALDAAIDEVIRKEQQ